MKMRTAGIVLVPGDLAQVYACKCNLIFVAIENAARTACPKCGARLAHVAQVAAAKDGLMAVAQNKAVSLPNHRPQLKMIKGGA